MRFSELARRRCVLTLVGAVAANIGLAASARAELIEIAWSAQQRFERSFDIAPGKFAELCGPLAPGSSVSWTYEAAAPLDFNIHYHLGKQVVFPEKRAATPRASGQLQVSASQDHCWMWTNKTAQSVGLRVQLAR